MNERKCDYKIIAFVNGIRQEFPCNSKDCLSLRIWGNGNHAGAGVNRVAKSELTKRDIDGAFEGAYVSGNCSGHHI